MTPTSSPDLTATAASEDYVHRMQVRAPLPQIIEALTDDTVIGRWWTVVTSSERHGDQVHLFMGDADPLITFTVAHIPGTREVIWAVTACVLADWAGTEPSFSMQPNADGTCDIEFRHVGLGPALECFDQCRAGWDHFMPSLHQFLQTGEGRPNEPRRASS